MNNAITCLRPPGSAQVAPDTESGHFNFDGLEVRVVSRGGEPWFVAADVCAVLDHGNARQVISRLDDDEKGVHILDTLGGAQSFAIINEFGLYSLILTSRKPEARRFKKWVTSEVLPSIRRRGIYTLAGSTETAEELAARALHLLQEKIAQQKAELAVAERKAVAHDLVAGAGGSLSLTETAKALKMPPKTLFVWLQANRWIYRRSGGGNWLGYQDRIDAGYLDHVATIIDTPNGGNKLTERVRVTGKGLVRLAALVTAESQVEVGGQMMRQG